MKILKRTIILLLALFILTVVFFSFIYKGASSHLVSKADIKQQSLIQKGQYLAYMGDCAACHTNKKANGATMAFAGGAAIESPVGNIYATNITPDKMTGIGEYTLQDFDNALRYGIRRDGKSLYPAMPYPSFAKVSGEDVEALYAYFMYGVEPVVQKNQEADITFPLSMRWPLAGWRMVFAPPVTLP